MSGGRDGDPSTHVVRDLRGEAVLVRRHPKLVWQDANGRGEHVLRDRASVGSAAESALRIADPTVSRLHAELEPRADGVWVRDLGSRNGTYVNGVRVVQGRVDRGMRMRLGAIELEVIDPSPPVPIELWPEESFGPLHGRSVAMRELFARLAKVARTDATVLVGGETGSGKELVAQAIHAASRRADGPYVVVDCGSIPEALLESELFGHARGAFTGATSARAGAIADADSGTVVLDEIGELPLALQPKLLRFLEARTVRRLGESQARSVDVRVIALTHRDLSAMVNTGAFREDLYFRLAVLCLRVPPLRERAEDISLLVERFRRGEAPLDPAWIDELAARPWLGNVRELRNAVERAEVFGVSDALEPPRAATGEASGEGFPEVSIDEPMKDIRERWNAHLEREYLVRALARHGGNVSAVARTAGLDRSHVYRLMLKHGL